LSNPKNIQDKLPGGNIFNTVFSQFRLMLRLLADHRINLFLKFIPFLTLIYLVVPLDFLVGPVDDIVVIYFGMEVFIQLCPPDIVEEHRRALSGKQMNSQDEEKLKDVVDGEFKDIKDK
jgi:uncharacterized membrane protein YkvA (DUF1232 family)